MQELDVNTITITVLGFIVVLLVLYELRKPKTMGSVNPQVLLERLSEVKEITENLSQQKCWCGNTMELTEVDLFGKNIALLKCKCGVTLQWSRQEGRGKAWVMSGKKGEPTLEKTVVGKVAEKSGQTEKSP